MKRLRILVVSSRLPNPPSWGFARRVYHLVNQLSERHDVTFVCFAVPEDTAESISDFGRRLSRIEAVRRPAQSNMRKRLRQVISLSSTEPFHVREVRDESLQRAVDVVMSSDRIDVVVLESSQLAWLRFPPGTAVVIDEHNIESEVLGRMAESETSLPRRWFNRVEHGRYVDFERAAWAHASGCAATSRRDAEVIQLQCPNLPVVVAPNGVDAEEFRPALGRPNPGSIVFTGLLEYRPNVEGIEWFIRDVLPIVRRARPDAHLTVVGDGPPSVLEGMRGPGVTVTGWVTDVRPYMDRSCVVIVPLRIGGGTRLKVVEAMSMGKAVVSTRLGAEGIELVPDTHLVYADEPGAFAAEVVGLLGDPERAARLGKAARALAIQRYSWKQSGQILEELLLTLV